MRQPSFMCVSLVVCAIAAMFALLVAIERPVYAQEPIQVGLVTTVDVPTHTLMLETQTGMQRVLVAAATTIHMTMATRFHSTISSRGMQ